MKTKSTCGAWIKAAKKNNNNKKNISTHENYVKFKFRCP